MIAESPFKPAWWLPGAHLQTIWPTLLRRRPTVELHRQRLELADGDFVDLDWTPDTPGPLVLVLHGLEGSSRSPYAAGMLRVLSNRGWRAVLMHARGCSGEPNRLARRYHAADTTDLDTVFHEIRRQAPDVPIAVLGYSLGGSVLLNWLAERRSPPDPVAAVAVSVPFDLGATVDRLARGFSRVYQRILLSQVFSALQTKHRRMDHPLAHRIRPRPRTFRAFDDAYTAPLHGFQDAKEYYGRASCRPRLRDIRTPVLIIQARDDPFMDVRSLPSADELPPHVTLELSTSGGHVGFVAGPPWAPVYWLETRIPEYLTGVFRGGSTGASR